MTPVQKREILHLAVKAGEILLQNGAEISRVQGTISYILQAYGVDSYSQYVVANGIFVTLDEGNEDNCTALRCVPTPSIHLGRIVAVNDLSRTIAQCPDLKKLKEYRNRLTLCGNVPHFPRLVQMLSSGVGCAAFCFLMSGSLYDSTAAFLCGVLLQLFLAFYGQNKLSHFMPTILGAGLVSSIAVGLTSLFPVLSLDFTTIGAIMPLVPGVAVTTSIRDFFNGDYLSGNIHLTDALLTGVCIAVGVGASQQFWQFMMGGQFL